MQDIAVKFTSREELVSLLDLLNRNYKNMRWGISDKSPSENIPNISSGWIIITSNFNCIQYTLYIFDDYYKMYTFDEFKKVEKLKEMISYLCESLKYQDDIINEYESIEILYNKLLTNPKIKLKLNKYK